jgi:hypothetical protein
VTIGQSLRCRLSIPVDGMPYEHVLFAVDQGRWILRPAPGMTGRIAQGDTIKTELGASVPVERGARGRIHIGEATILFQEIAAPPIAPRPQLPASIRGTLGDRIDRRLAIIVGASLLLHIGIASWAWMTDREGDVGIAREPRVFHQETVTTIDLPEDPPAPTTGPGTATPVAPSQTPAPIVPPTRITTRPTVTQTPVDPNAYAQILTGNDGTPNGANEIRARQPGADLDKQIREVNASNRTVQTTRVTREDGLPRPGTVPHTNFDGGGIQHVERPEERDPYVYIPPVPPPPRPPGGVPTIDTVLAKIKGQYMGSLKRCYSKALLGDGSLHGKVTLEFTIDARGHVIDPAASGLSSDVDGCVSGLMPGWIFPGARDKDGEPTEKPFKLSVVFQPGN